VDGEDSRGVERRTQVMHDTCYNGQSASLVMTSLRNTKENITDDIDALITSLRIDIDEEQDANAIGFFADPKAIWGLAQEMVRRPQRLTLVIQV
jgi:hypothetical protein